MVSAHRGYDICQIILVYDKFRRFKPQHIWGMKPHILFGYCLKEEVSLMKCNIDFLPSNTDRLSIILFLFRSCEVHHLGFDSKSLHYLYKQVFRSESN